MTKPKSYLPLSEAEMASLQSEKGKKARKASPWGRHPMCSTERAAMALMRYKAKAR